MPGPVGIMAEERKLSVSEVRKSISTTLATSFGFVIALMWNNVVQGGLSRAGVNLQATGDWFGWAGFVVTALVLTVVMILLIIVISRWGSKK
jgi:hypothetical protein